jgi:integrase
MIRTSESKNPPVRISREDVVRVFEYAREKCCLENYVLVRLFMQLGPRTNEVCTLRVENIEYDTCHISLLDSKKKILVKLPLDVETLELLRLLVGKRHEGYVFRQLQSWKLAKRDKPLTKQTMWCRIRKIATQAGVPGFKPRIFRQYFAAQWDFKKRGTRKSLQFILRHDSKTSTDVYVEKIVFREDVELEYRLLMDPIARALQTESLPQVCRDCRNSPTCKFLEDTPNHVTGCQFKSAKQRVIM